MANLDLSATFELIDRVSPVLERIPLPLRRTQEAFDKAKSALKDFERQSKMLDSFKQRSERVAQVAEQFDKAKERVRLLGEQMARVQNPSQRLINQFNAAQRAATELEQRLQGEREVLERLNGQLRQAGVNTDRLSDEQRRLQSATDTARSALDRQAVALERQQQLRARYQSAQDKLTGVKNIARNTAIATAGAVAVPVKLAIDFESAMADVKKVVDFGDDPQIASREFRAMSDEIVRLSTVYPMAAKDIAAIFAAGGQTGIAEDELGAYAQSAIKMGVAFDIGADKAGRAMAELRTAFQMNQADVDTLADKINYLGNTTPNSADKILEVVQRIGSLGGVAGVSSDQIAALAGSVTSVAPEVAATGIKNMMMYMTKGESATKSQKKAFAKLGLSAAEVAKNMQIDSMGTFLDTLERIKTLPKEMQVATINDIFGAEALPIIAQYVDNTDNLRKNLQAMGDATLYAGSMQAEYDSRAATTANNIQLFKNNLSAVAITLGETLLPLLNRFLDATKNVIQKVQAWIKQNPELAARLMKIAVGIGIVSAAIAVLSAFLIAILSPLALLHANFLLLSGGVGVFAKLSSALSGMWAILARFAPMVGGVLAQGLMLLGKALVFVTAKIITLGIAMLTSPIFWIIAAIVAGIAVIAYGVYQIYQNWGSIVTFFRDLFNRKIAELSAFWARIVGIWNSIKASVMNVANTLWSSLGIRFNSGIMALIAIIVAFSPVGLFMRAFMAVFGYFNGLASQFRSYGANMIEGLKNGIMGKLGSVLSTIQNTASRIKSAFTSAMSIHSPSRVFMGYGDDIMQGLDNGLMANNSPIATMLSTADTLKSAVDTSQISFDNRPPIHATQDIQPTSQGVSPININIYPQPHQSPTDIAQLVAHELGRLGVGTPTGTALYDYAEAWG